MSATMAVILLAPMSMPSTLAARSSKTKRRAGLPLT